MADTRASPAPPSAAAARPPGGPAPGAWPRESPPPGRHLEAGADSELAQPAIGLCRRPPPAPCADWLIRRRGSFLSHPPPRPQPPAGYLHNLKRQAALLPPETLWMAEGTTSLLSAHSVPGTEKGSFDAPHKPVSRTLLILILWIEQLRLREGKNLSGGHTASQQSYEGSPKFWPQRW